MGVVSWFKGTYLATHLEVGQYTRRRNPQRSQSLSDAEIIKNYIEKEVLGGQPAPIKKTNNSNNNKVKKSKEEKTQRDLKAIENYIGADLFNSQKFINQYQNKNKNTNRPSLPQRRQTEPTIKSNNNKKNSEFEASGFEDNFVPYDHTQSSSNSKSFDLFSDDGPEREDYIDLDHHFNKNQGYYHGH